MKKRRLNGTPVKVLLFVTLLGFIAYRLWMEDWSQLNGLHFRSPIYLVLSFLLIVANQGCEWLKWKITARSLSGDAMAVRRAFFSGIGAGFLTPNGWGNFLGRMTYFRKRDRMYIVLASFVSNVSQVLPTLLFGAIACFFIPKIPVSLGYISLVISLAILLVFFFGEHIVPRKKTRNKFLRHFRLLETQLGSLRKPLFGWSLVRFLVFSFQYVLLFMAFGYTDVWFLLTNVWMIFLLTSIVPSLWSGKIVIRETAAIFVFTGTMVSIPDAVVVSLLIWVFNNAIPAAVSSFAWLPVSKPAAHVVD